MKSFPLQTILAASLVVGSVSVRAQNTTAPPDNTKNNQSDRNTNRTTADQQKNNQSDIELARQIRKALVNDKSLSTNAHNVKVVVEGGMVTLKGPVNSADEKQAVETKASQLAGSDKVTSELQIAAK